MTKTLTLPVSLITLAIFLLAGMLLLKPFNTVEGAGQPGTSVFSQFATTTTVGPQAVPAVTIFALNDQCKSRVISTRGEGAISIAFGDPSLVKQTAGELGSTTVSGAKGFLQAASTTVAYDSGIYGCGRWSAFGFASTTITVSEF